MHSSIGGLALIGLVILAAVIAIIAATTNLSGASSVVCDSNTIFDEFSDSSLRNAEFDPSTSQVHLDNAGNIAYLYEDFEQYAGNQIVIDEFEDAEEWRANGEGELRIASEYYGGSGALAYLAPAGREIDTITLQRESEVTQDFSMLANTGYLTMWINVPHPEGIDSVTIALQDESGNSRTYSPLQNIHASGPNTFQDDTEYPDLVYIEGDPKRERWTDFMLGSGWNYLLWRTDDYHDEGIVQLEKIMHLFVILNVNEDLSAGGQLIFDNLRMQSGLQKSSNPTGGVWYPPHGRPQYGVYDIDKSEDGQSYELRLLNVRNTQYPSNGDHARMISSAPVPIDFVMRVEFTLNQLGPEDEQITLPSLVPAWTPPEWREVPIHEGQRNNTYFRITYDFEPAWDPGHDWFGTYLSLQYGKFGLSSVWPLERNILQDQEPKAGARTAITEFSPKSDVRYEMNLLVKGQLASATIYEIKSSDCIERKSAISYIFEHARQGNDKRYPVAIESTGNMRTIIHEVEIVSLEDGKPNAEVNRFR